MKSFAVNEKSIFFRKINISILDQVFISLISFLFYNAESIDILVQRKNKDWVKNEKFTLLRELMLFACLLTCELIHSFNGNSHTFILVKSYPLSLHKRI